MDSSTVDSARTAIVVGGGPAGLIAAARLAEGGVAVTLLEASAGLGGRAASERRDGFDLNQGPHALYEGGPALRELRALGIDVPRWNPLSQRSVFVRGGRVRRLPGGSASAARWVAGLLRRDSAELAGLPVSAWLERELASEGARATVAAFVRLATFVADRNALSADVAATQLRLALYPGVRYVRGGWQTLIDALAARAEACGASLRTRAGVRGLRRSGDGWEAAVEDETLRGDMVVVAAGGPDACAKLLGERAPAPPGPAAELSTLDLGLSSLPRRGRRFALGVDEPSYLSVHSPPRHPAGDLLSLASYARRPRAELELVADAVQPGWRERVTLERFLPRMVAVSSVPGPDGGGLAGRPAVNRGEGLYLAGDWVGGEGWLVDAAISSGAAAAAAALCAPVAAPK